jgi:energy-coupling factor transporter ATP-binding protein EcfA2
MSLLELDRVSYSYPGSPKPALKNLSLSIDEGEYVALVGANGSGKSSLLRLLDGLRIPSSGQLRVRGLSISGEEGRKAARIAVGLVFQSPADQIVSSSVEEDVAFGPENLGLPRDEISARVGAALEAVGLSEQRLRPSHFLSAGQQQRLAVAGALALGPACLAFDEATAMLDPEARERILGLMDSLSAAGKTIIHATHDMSEAARASRLILLAEGSVAFDGPPAVFFALSASAEAGRGLGLPDCVALALSLGLPPLLGESASSLARRIAEAAASGGLPRPSSNRPASRAASASSAGPAFALSGVGHAYLRGTADELVSLRGIDLSLPRGAMTAFVGRTGSGKSTVLQLLDSLVEASAGRVRSLGIDLADPGADLRSLRTRAPLAIQRPESALFELYAADDVAFGPRNLGLSGPALVERVRRSMERAGLSYAEFRDRRSRSLSGGEKRSLALAGVLAMEGEALLLDEPTSSLDPAAKRSVMTLVLGAAGSGATVVMATHSMEEAAEAGLVVVFCEGRVVALGDPESVFYGTLDPAWGIRRPFACELALELEALGLDTGRPLDARGLAAAFGAALLGEARR